MEKVLESGEAVVALSAPGARKSGPALGRLEKQWPGRVLWQAGAAWGLDEGQPIYAVADVVLFAAPGAACSRGPLLAQAAGAIPVWHQPGPASNDASTFRDYNARSLAAALRRALHLWSDRPARQARRRRSLAQVRRRTWARLAPQQLALYRQAIRYRQEAVERLDPAPAS